MSKSLSIQARNYLPAFVYGGIDGLITTFAVVSGSAGANLDTRIVLILGFANLLADGLSMSIGAYLSQESNSNDAQKPIITALITFGSFNLLGIIPLLIYIVGYTTDMELTDNFLYASIATTVGFLVIGFVRMYVDKNKMALVQTILLGAVAASIAYYVGDFLEGLIR